MKVKVCPIHQLLVECISLCQMVANGRLTEYIVLGLMAGYGG